MNRITDFFDDVHFIRYGTIANETKLVERTMDCPLSISVSTAIVHPICATISTYSQKLSAES